MVIVLDFQYHWQLLPSLLRPSTAETVLCLLDVFCLFVCLIKWLWRWAIFLNNHFFGTRLCSHSAICVLATHAYLHTKNTKGTNAQHWVRGPRGAFISTLTGCSLSSWKLGCSGARVLGDLWVLMSAGPASSALEDGQAEESQLYSFTLHALQLFTEGQRGPRVISLIPFHFLNRIWKPCVHFKRKTKESGSAPWALVEVSHCTSFLSHYWSWRVMCPTHLTQTVIKAMTEMGKMMKGTHSPNSTFGNNMLRHILQTGRERYRGRWVKIFLSITAEMSSKSRVSHIQVCT